MNKIFKNEISPIIICLLINFLYRSLGISKNNEDLFRENKEKNKNVIFAFWHGRQFIPLFVHAFKDVVIMTSLSEDGELQTKIMSKFGYDIVRGSAEKRGAVEGTIKLIEKANQFKDVAFAVDGPRGPGFIPKPGVIFTAKKTGRVIIPVSSSAKHKKIFDNWDKYLFPFPFNKCIIIYGNPVVVRKEDNIEAKTKELELELNRITDIADDFLKHTRKL